MFLSSCSIGLTVPLEPWWGTQDSSRVGGYSGFLSTCGGASSQVVLGRLVSSRDVQSASCLFPILGGYSLVLAWDFSIVVVGVNSVVVVGLVLSTGVVQTPLYLWCDVLFFICLLFICGGWAPL